MSSLIIDADTSVPRKVVHQNRGRSCAIAGEVFLADPVQLYRGDTWFQALFHQQQGFKHNPPDGLEVLEVVVVIYNHRWSTESLDKILHLVLMVFCVGLLG